MSENYILYLDKHLVITNKFTRKFGYPPNSEQVQDFIKMEKSLKALETVPSKSIEVYNQDKKLTQGITQVVAQVEIIDPLIQFISDAEIPIKSKTKVPYKLNAYNARAEIVLKKILDTPGFDYRVLVLATKLYYKSNNFPVSISNFFIQGLWKGEYLAMEESIKTGTVNSLIKKNVSEDEGYSRYD